MSTSTTIRNPGPTTLARIAGTARTAFATCFRKVPGVRPDAILTDWRLPMARSLLVETDLAVDDIVARIGDGSVAAFSQAFERRHGRPQGRFCQDRAA